MTMSGLDTNSLMDATAPEDCGASLLDLGAGFRIQLFFSTFVNLLVWCFTRAIISHFVEAR